MSEKTEQEIPKVQEQTSEENNHMSYDDGVIKVNLGELNKSESTTETTEEQNIVVDTTMVEPTAVNDVAETPVGDLVEDATPIIESAIEEISDEEIVAQAEDLQEDVHQALTEQQNTGVELPENIQKVVEFMQDTGGSLEDYVKLNTDYSSLNEKQLLREYYESTKPHLDSEEIDFLMEDDFSYDEDLDDERDIRKKKIAYKEELSKAKNYLDGLKSKYYEEIKAGSKLNPEQQKAIEFFNRHKKENEEAIKIADKQTSTFKAKTESLFSNDFKGFDFNIGDKKFRYKVNNADQVKTSQSDINNFVKKFLNDKNEMSDAAGYHKSLFTAMNADSIANHFYQQGKADAIRDSVKNAKNIDMTPRGVHEEVQASNGWKVKSISGGHNSSKLRIKKI